MVEQGGCVVQEYAQTVVDGSWHVWFPPRRRSRARVSVLEFDRVSEDMLPRSDSFNGNGFASGKPLWRSEKLLIRDEATSSSSDVVICLPHLWRSLQWCWRRRIESVGILHRFILSFQFCKIGIYVPCNVILSYEWDTYCFAKKITRMNTSNLRFWHSLYSRPLWVFRCWKSIVTYINTYFCLLALQIYSRNVQLRFV
jgi:hypothetical protein